MNADIHYREPGQQGISTAWIGGCIRVFETAFSRRMKGCWILPLALAVPVAPARGSEDAVARGVFRNQLARQQQQERLRLDMLHYRRDMQPPATGAREDEARRRLAAEQRARQQALHHRQEVAPSSVQLADDAGTRRAKEDMELARARREGELLLERARWELQQKP